MKVSISMEADNVGRTVQSLLNRSKPPQIYIWRHRFEKACKGLLFYELKISDAGKKAPQQKHTTIDPMRPKGPLKRI
jgi:hypothetical protein